MINNEKVAKLDILIFTKKVGVGTNTTVTV